jgi:hypothetical protein
LARNNKTGVLILCSLLAFKSNRKLQMKRLFLASLLLMQPVSARAGSYWAPALTSACIMDLTALAKDPQAAIGTALKDKFERMCRCAANKTLNVVELRGDNATEFDSVFKTALFTCIPEQ